MTGHRPEMDCVSSARPLRLGFVLFDYPTVSEAFIANHARSLADLGVELTVLALARQGGDEIERTPGGASFRILGGGMPHGALARWRKAALDVPLSRLSVLSLANPLRHGRAALSLKAVYLAPLLLRAGPLDVLHCHFAPLGDAAVAARAAGYTAARIVAHFRGYDITSYVRKHGASVYRRLFAEADHFLANCEYFRNSALALGCPPDRLSLLRSGIDLGRFPFRPHSSLALHPLTLASVGRLVEKKGFSDVLEALAILKAQGIAVRYRLIGAGPLREVLALQARRLGIEELVDFHGAVPNEALAPLLAECDIFIAPSVTAASGDQDGPTNTVKEAMALGLPVIATAHAGLMELVLDRVTGLSVPERRPDEIARAVLRFLEAPQLVSAVVAEGRRMVEREYDVEKLNARLLGIYGRTMSSSRERHTVLSNGPVSASNSM